MFLTKDYVFGSIMAYESEAALSMMGVSSVSGLHDLEHPDVVLADEW